MAVGSAEATVVKVKMAGIDFVESPDVLETLLGSCVGIAGGATMFGQRTDRDVGEKNHKAVLEHLRSAGIPVVAKHIGGDKGRMIRFSTADGSVEVSIARQVVTTL